MLQSRLSVVFLTLGSGALLTAQSNFCVTSAVPPIVRAEGLAERIGDILYTCSGVPNTTFTGNFTIALNAAITNRISAGNALAGIVFTIDGGSGPQPILVQPLLSTSNTLVFNGVTFTLSAQGGLDLRVAGIRVNATQVPVNYPIVASLGINVVGLALNSAQVVVGRSQRGLYAGFNSRLVCAQNGSPLPATVDFTNLILARTAFASTRFTEGFADALGPRSAEANFNADAGERVIVRYSGFPQDARLFVPDAIAGSDAVQPTAGGDFGLPASGGAYAPVAGGTLLLARVGGANANGAGGIPVYSPGAIGSGTVTFNSVSELTITNGSAYVVYEVVDANRSAIETAQFPTFLGLAPDGNRSAAETSETLSFAAVSTVGNASATEAIPRFAVLTPLADCGIIGDCATYLPALAVDITTIQFTALVGGPTQQGYFTVRNAGGGSMPWTASILYSNGGGWLSLDTNQGTGGQNVRVYAAPGSLAPGVYKAAITVDAGSVAGSKTIGVTFTVLTPPPAPPPLPAISAVLNAASFGDVPVVPGSLTTIMGSAFGGKIVSATFDGLLAQVLFSNSSQINLLVPSELGAKNTAQLVVTVDGASGPPRTVTLAPFAPAIFKGAVLNQDYSVNDTGSGAAPGSVIQIFATGLSGAGTITGRIHDRDIPIPYYAGPAPGFMGVQQVNLVVPADLPAMTTAVYVCAAASAPPSSRICSLPAPLTIR